MEDLDAALETLAEMGVFARAMVNAIDIGQSAETEADARAAMEEAVGLARALIAESTGKGDRI